MKIEKIKPIKSKVSYHFFTEDENDYVNSADADNDLKFLEVWTKKEAYFKCAEIKESELSLVSVISKLKGFSFETEMFDNHIISICKKE